MLYAAYDYLSTQGLELIHVSKSDPGKSALQKLTQERHNYIQYHLSSSV